jgi:hypothetical protein
MDGAQALLLFQSLGQRLNTDLLWLRTMDMQGPMNTAGLICNQEEMLAAMYEQPELVHRLLDRTTDFVIETNRCLRRQAGARIGGSIWPYVFFPGDRGVVFTEDMMPLLSTDMYARFAPRYLRRLQQELGQLVIHCCGDWGRHARTLADAGLDIAAVEFHYPFTRIEELEPLADRCVFIPYLAIDQQDRFTSTSEFYRHLLETTGPGVGFWFSLGQ